MPPGLRDLDDALDVVVVEVANGCALPDSVSHALHGIVDLPTRAAQERLAALRRRVRGPGAMAVVDALLVDPTVNFLVESFSTSFLAVAVARDAAAITGRSIVKYTYVTPIGWQWSARALWVRTGIRAASLSKDLPLVRSSASYHLDVEAPEALEVRRARILRETRGTTSPRVLSEQPGVGARTPFSSGHG